MPILAALAAAGCSLPGLPAGSAAPECRAVVAAEGETLAAPVRWTTTVGERERRVLDAWCAAVAPGIIDPTPLPGGTEPVDSLVIVTWNSHAGGGDIERLVEDLRTGKLGAPPRHFVLLLQESFREGLDNEPPPGAVLPRAVRTILAGRERTDVAAVARKLGLAMLYVPSMWNGAGEDRGNAILSTLPLADARVIELPFESQRRVAVAATVHAPGGGGKRRPLRVVSVHLDTRAVGARIWAAFGAGRLRQTRALVGALPDDGTPTVLAGDLNTWSLALLEGSIDFLRERFPDTPDDQTRPTLVTDWGLRRTLDHVFFELPDRWTPRVRRLDDRYGSDHFPLLGSVAFPESP